MIDLDEILQRLEYAKQQGAGGILISQMELSGVVREELKRLGYKVNLVLYPKANSNEFTTKICISME